MILVFIAFVVLLFLGLPVGFSVFFPVCCIFSSILKSPLQQFLSFLLRRYKMLRY